MSDPGIIYGPDLRDWSTKATTPDQWRIESYIDRCDLRQKRVLHIGIGNSGLAKRFHRCVREIVGTTIDDPEIRVAKAAGLANYAFVKHNKYSGHNGNVPGLFDVIVDNNPTSPCCCMRHLGTLFDFYVEKLAPGGFVVTDGEGLEWIPDGASNAWSFGFEDLSAVAAAKGLRTFRVTPTVYLMTFTAPPKPTLPSLLRHVGRRARALPGKLARRGPREAARIVQAVLMVAVPWAVPTRLRRGRRANHG